MQFFYRPAILVSRPTPFEAVTARPVNSAFAEPNFFFFVFLNCLTDLGTVTYQSRSAAKQLF